MGTSKLLTTLPAAMAGLCAAAMGPYQGTADQQVPQISQTQTTGSAKPALLDPRALHAGNGPLSGPGAPGGGGAGVGGECTYSNVALGPLDDLGNPASQKDDVGIFPATAFFAEAADDFVLPGFGSNDCEISQVRFWVTQGPDPLNSWTGLKITIYEDVGVLAGEGNPPSGDPHCPLVKGPSGFPVPQALPDRAHTACDAGGIGVVCEMKININQITAQLINFPCAGTAWEVLATELNQFACRLQKNRKYWIAIAPVMDFETQGQSFWMLSDIPTVDHPAQQIFEGAGLDTWTTIAGNVGNPAPAGCAGVPPPATHRDLAFEIIATKFVKPCPEDVTGDGVVNVLDLIDLLLCFGQPATGACGTGQDINQDGVINVLDLIALLLQFGAVCPPTNDLNVAFTQVGVGPVDPCCIFDITVTNKGTDPVTLFYLDLEFGSGGFICPTTITFPPGWIAGVCFDNLDPLAHRQTFLVTGPGIAPGGTLLGTATLEAIGANTLVSRPFEIPFAVPGEHVHCHVTDVDNGCGLLSGPHSDNDSNGGPDFPWSDPNDWRCAHGHLPQGCQQPDNLGHGVTVLAGFSTCTPGSVAANASAFAISDDFNIDVTQTVDHVRWWGVYVAPAAPAGVICDPTLVVALQNFEINFYADDADGADNIPGTFDDHCPGANLVDHIGLVDSVINTGRIIGGLPVWEFEIKLPTPIVLTAGSCYWLSVRARMDLLDPINDCTFGWQTAGDPPFVGNGRSLQQGDGVTCNPLIPAPWICPTDQSLYDLAWCLQGPDPLGQVPVNLGDPQRCLPPQDPHNKDVCAFRFPLVEPGVFWTTGGANTDGPPADPLLCITQGGGPFNDVWFNYTATCTGLLTVTTCVDLGGSADIDTVIVVYDGCICNPAPPFQPLGPQIACNDNDSLNPCGDPPTSQSTVLVPVVAGNCYKVQLGGFAAGDFGSAPTNFLGATCVVVGKDICFGAEDATPPTGGSVKVNNDTGAFSVDAAPVCDDQVTGLPVPLLAPGVWYSVIGDGTTLTATTCNDRTLYDTALSVYCAPCNDLFCVGANNDDPGCGIRPLASTVTWCSALGQEYLILVHGATAADAGPFGLSVSSDGILCPDPAPCDPPPSCFLEGAPGATCQAEDTSNANNINPAAFTVADDFTPVAASTVTEGCIWLVTLDGGTIHSLTVSYFLNDPVLDIPDDGPPIPLNTPPIATYSLLAGTLTQVGPNFTGTNVVGFLVQELGWSHAPLSLAGGVCHWIEITDTTPTSSAFWELGLGGNSNAVQDGTPVLNGYDALDVNLVDHRFCLDIAWDLSDCAPVVPPCAPPVNNLCANRIPLLNGLTAITTCGATTDGIATNGTGDCDAFAGPQIHNDIWFNYTAPAGALQLVVATCPLEGTGGSAGYDTKIAVYDGCSTAGCPFGGNEIACNDDDVLNGCAATFEATVTAPVVAGNCYKVRVGGFGPGDSGTATLSVHN